MDRRAEGAAGGAAGLTTPALGVDVEDAGTGPSDVKQAATGNATYRTFETFAIASAFYLTISFAIMALGERRPARAAH